VGQQHDDGCAGFVFAGDEASAQLRLDAYYLEENRRDLGAVEGNGLRAAEQRVAAAVPGERVERMRASPPIDIVGV
jgi:hypothetical protein